MSEYQSFYEMVKKWTINDYRTQKVKSEVIVDMLISDFIEEMVSYGVKNDNVRLIAKEFPIERISQAENEHQYASVDYLLSDMSNNVYLTELKTTTDSFDIVQLLNMLGVCKRDICELRNPLEYAVLDYGIQKRFNDRGTKKYLYTMKKMIDYCKLERRDVSSFSDNKRSGDKQKIIAKKIIDDVFKKLESAKAKTKILYISLHKIEDKMENAQIPDGLQYKDFLLKPIILSDMIDDDDFIKKLSPEKQSAWKKTTDIIKDMLKPYSDWYNYI